VDVATDQSVQSNLQAQIAKYKSDLDPLKTYPIASFGVAYSFHVR
jgi:ubiquinone biosynthesis protein Coq4